MITTYLLRKTFKYPKSWHMLIFAAAMAVSKTVAFHTLGCKLNFSETSSISRLLEKEGFEKKSLTARQTCM